MDQNDGTLHLTTDPSFPSIAIARSRGTRALNPHSAPHKTSLDDDDDDVDDELERARRDGWRIDDDDEDDVDGETRYVFFVRACAFACVHANERRRRRRTMGAMRVMRRRMRWGRARMRVVVVGVVVARRRASRTHSARVRDGVI